MAKKVNHGDSFLVQMEFIDSSNRTIWLTFLGKALNQSELQIAVSNIWDTF